MSCGSFPSDSIRSLSSTHFALAKCPNRALRSMALPSTTTQAVDGAVLFVGIDFDTL